MSPSVPRILPPGHRLHWYEIESVIGQGGFGVTYAAHDTNLNHPVAVKEYYPHSVAVRDGDSSVRAATESDRDSFEWGLSRFIDEARTLARLRHPNVVRVVSVFEANGTAYMVMEREQGTSLLKVATRGRFEGEDALLRLLGALLAGLEQVHAAGFIHRDIKPSNIIVRDDGSPVLLDFGSARRALAGGARGLTTVVSRGYAPFEQHDASGEMRQGPWTDIYAMGAVMYHLIIGRAPPDALERGGALLEGAPDPFVPAATLAGARFSERLLQAVDRALAFRHEERPQSIAEWRVLLPQGVERRGDAAADGPAPPVPSSSVADVERTLRLDQGETAQPGSPASRGDGALRALRVLVVDDEPFVLGLVQRVLTRLGVGAFSTAENGRAALAAIDAAASPPHVVLCDLSMPDMDGLEFIRHLAARPQAIDLILMSGVDSRVLDAAEGLARAHGLNVLGALAKPVKPDPLRALLHSRAPTQRRSSRGPEDPISEVELDEGLKGDAVEVVYQPQVDVATRQVIGVEALARWRHPVRGTLGPGTFIPLAEETGRMDLLTDAVLRQATARLGDWQADGLTMALSINVSVDTLGRLDFPDRVVRMAAAEGVAPDRLTLEVTETRVMRDLRSALEVLMRLRLKGIGLSIDDFGTGYSSLQQLQRVPFTEVKVDRAFVHGAVHDPSAGAILESSVQLGRKLGLRIVAEGVEDQADWDKVASLDCDLVQGYHVAKPMPGAAFPDWVSDWQAGR